MTPPSPLTRQIHDVASLTVPSAHRVSRVCRSEISPVYCRLINLTGRIEFVILRIGHSCPVALHPASRRRSYFLFQARNFAWRGLATSLGRARSQAHSSARSAQRTEGISRTFVRKSRWRGTGLETGQRRAIDGKEPRGKSTLKIYFRFSCVGKRAPCSRGLSVGGGKGNKSRNGIRLSARGRAAPFAPRRVSRLESLQGIFLRSGLKSDFRQYPEKTTTFHPYQSG